MALRQSNLQGKKLLQEYRIRRKIIYTRRVREFFLVSKGKSKCNSEFRPFNSKWLIGEFSVMFLSSLLAFLQAYINSLCSSYKQLLVFLNSKNFAAEESYCNTPKPRIPFLCLFDSGAFFVSTPKVITFFYIFFSFYFFS